MFLEKLRVQGWLGLFTNTQMGCSVPDLIKFYANCKVTDGVVTSEVNGKKVHFDVKKLGAILGANIPISQERRHDPSTPVALLVYYKEHHPTGSRLQLCRCNGSMLHRLDRQGGAN